MAKKLLDTKQCGVTIFEKGSTVGGLWAPGGLIDPHMRTNLCRFTVAFSGLSWESIELGQSLGTAPIYPEAWQVYAYLETFYRRYIPEGVVRFATSVRKAELVASPDESYGDKSWKITTSSADSDNMDVQEHLFDYLVVASGQFSHPHMPDPFSGSGGRTETTVPMIHSTQYRALSDIGSKANNIWRPESKILVVGGSHSGSEVATTVASHLFHASEHGYPANCKVVHLSSRKMFALPSLLRTSDKEACKFEPSDFKLYNRSNLPVDAIPSFKYGLWDGDQRRGVGKMIESLISGNDDVPEDDEQIAMRLSAVISDSYPQLLQLGVIEPLQGEIQETIPSAQKDDLTVTIKTSTGAEHVMENVVGVVYATGFNPAASLSYLSDEVRSLLEFESSCPQLPVILDTSYLCQNMAVPNLAVLGFGPQYWAVVEMQARAVAKAWITDQYFPEVKEREGLKEYWKTLRDVTKGGDLPSLPPNPFGDYVGLFEQAARELQLESVGTEMVSTQGPIFAARYIETNDEKGKMEALKTMTNFRTVLSDIEEANIFVTRIVFNGLLGKWLADRNESGLGGSSPLEMTIQPRQPGSLTAETKYAIHETSSSHIDSKVFRYNESSNEITVEGLAAGDVKPVTKLEILNDAGGPDTIVAKLNLDLKGSTFLKYSFVFVGALLKRIHVENWTQDKQSTSAIMWTRASH
jgi:hypothetical protein